MNAFWKRFISAKIKSRKKKTGGQHAEVSVYVVAKGFREFKLTVIRFLKDFALITAGIFSAAFGLESFLLPNTFIDGGATGISLLTSELTGVELPLLLVFFNIPFIILGFKVISKQFAIKTAIAISAMAVCIAVVHFPEVTHDKLLVAVFGGFFLGAGIGLSVRGGAVLDGTEVLAIFFSRKLHLTIGDIIIVFNVVIFSAAAYLLSIDAALYSMITYLAASKIVDFVIEGIEEYTGVTIISPHNLEMKEMISEKLGRGVTVYKGTGGIGKQGIRNEIDIVYTVITRLELSRMYLEIQKIDSNAFVVTSSVKETKGGMIKKRRLK